MMYFMGCENSERRLVLACKMLLYLNSGVYNKKHTLLRCGYGRNYPVASMDAV